MYEHWIAINKTTGKIFHGKQGVYRSEGSLNKALSHWAGGNAGYEKINITETMGLAIIKEHGATK